MATYKIPLPSLFLLLLLFLFLFLLLLLFRRHFHRRSRGYFHTELYALPPIPG
ncbi:hypothetical protein YW7DRAFT_00420 [Streptomyces sp. AmelKG-E11A]|nr:hypothetical protein YW7DRAFT_00420 [Streptomyces sp. AmelKG-E11A]